MVWWACVVGVGVCFWGVVGRVLRCVGVGVFLPVGIVRGRGAAYMARYFDVCDRDGVGGVMVWIMAWARRGAA